jgi:hypothetical protein
MNGGTTGRSGWRLVAAFCVAASLGLFASQARAAAPTNCGQDDSTVAVAFVGIGESNILLTAQQDGTFTGAVTIRVFCRDLSGSDIGEVLGSTVTITTNVHGTTFDGQAASEGSTATIDLPLGVKTVMVVSTDPGLAPGVSFARVGDQSTITTVIFASAVPDGWGPGGRTTIFARTPELSSVVLLASGGAGAFGYLFIAARSKRRRD